MVLDVITTGAVNWDVNLFIESIELQGMEAPVKRIMRVPGGKAANVAVAAARLLGPGRVGILGAVGNDEIGRSHMEIFAKEGVSTDHLLVVNGSESGQAYILVDSRGRNQIFTHFGANASLTADMAKSLKIASVLHNSKVLVAMDPPLDYTAELFAEAGKDCTIIWGPGVRTINNQEKVLSMLGYVDYLLLNQQELFVLTGKATAEMGYEMLSSYSDSLKLLVTLGEEGAAIHSRAGVIKAGGVDLSKGGYTVVNTVGCGDAFVGCFAASLASGLEESQALTRANYAGAFKSTKYETRGSPTSDELDEFARKLNSS